MLTACLLLFAQYGPPAPAPSVPEMVAQFAADCAAAERTASGPFDERRWSALDAVTTQWLAALETVDFAALDPAEQLDWLLLRRAAQHRQRENLRARERTLETAPLLPFAPPLQQLCSAWVQRAPVEPAAAAETLAKAEEAITAARKDFEQNRPQVTAAVAGRAAERAEQLRHALEEWYGFYAEYDPQFTWWMASPWGGVRAALDEYGKFLRETVGGWKPDDPNQLVGDPIGRAALLEALAFECIPYTPEELMAIAERERQWCLAELRRAAGEMGLGEDWQQALEQVKGRHVAPGEQPQLIRKLADEAALFLTSNHLVTVPPLCQDSWRMAMMSPERQKLNPYFLGGETIIISFPTTGMEHADKRSSLRSNNVHFCRATVHHELIPGHHLQGYMAERWRPWRREFGTPFLWEGWALYWEMLLWDRGFFPTPEDRVGALFWRNHRTARIVFSLNFHLGNWSPQQCVDFLVAEVGHERQGAEAEVRRSIQGGYGPLYQCAYMLGGLQLRALAAELVDGGHMGLQEFHDAVLRENSIPIAYLRAALAKTPLRRDFAPQWRFADR